MKNKSKLFLYVSIAMFFIYYLLIIIYFTGSYTSDTYNPFVSIIILIFFVELFLLITQIFRKTYRGESIVMLILILAPILYFLIPLFGFWYDGNIKN